MLLHIVVLWKVTQLKVISIIILKFVLHKKVTYQDLKAIGTLFYLAEMHSCRAWINHRTGKSVTRKVICSRNLQPRSTASFLTQMHPAFPQIIASAPKQKVVPLVGLWLSSRAGQLILISIIEIKWLSYHISFCSDALVLSSVINQHPSPWP